MTSKEDFIADGHRRMAMTCLTTLINSTKPSRFTKLFYVAFRYLLSKQDYKAKS